MRNYLCLVITAGARTFGRIYLYIRRELSQKHFENSHDMIEVLHYIQKPTIQMFSLAVY